MLLRLNYLIAEADVLFTYSSIFGLTFYHRFTGQILVHNLYLFLAFARRYGRNHNTNNSISSLELMFQSISKKCFDILPTYVPLIIPFQYGRRCVMETLTDC